MINESISEGFGEGKPWNTDEQLQDGLTAKEAAIFMGSYMGTFRLLEGLRPKGIEEQLKMLQSLIEVQSKAVFQHSLGSKNPEETARILQMGMAAAFFAGLASIVDAPIETLFRLTGTAMDIAQQIAEAKPEELKTGIIKYKIRPGECKDMFQVGGQLEPIAAAKAKLKDSEVGDIVAKIRQEEQMKDGQPGNN